MILHLWGFHTHVHCVDVWVSCFSLIVVAGHSWQNGEPHIQWPKHETFVVSLCGAGRERSRDGSLFLPGLLRGVCSIALFSFEGVVALWFLPCAFITLKTLCFNLYSLLSMLVCLSPVFLLSRDKYHMGLMSFLMTSLYPDGSLMTGFCFTLPLCVCIHICICAYMCIHGSLSAAYVYIG